MTIGKLIYHLPYPINIQIRQFESFHRKIINNNYTNVFNKTCKKEKLLPSYTNIYKYINIYI